MEQFILIFLEISAFILLVLVFFWNECCNKKPERKLKGVKKIFGIT
jgi:hypothetical protein